MKSNIVEYSDFIYAKKCGIIDIRQLQADIERMKRKEYLDSHPYSIYESKGIWYTYVATPDAKAKRRKIKRRSREALEDELVRIYKERVDEPTFQECFKRWSQEKLSFGFIEKQTYDRYETDYNHFLSEYGKNKVKDIDEDNLYEFVFATINDNKLTAKAWGNLRTLISGTLKYAKRKHYTSFSVGAFMADLDIAKNAYKHRVFSDEESVFTDKEMDLLYTELDKEPESILCEGIRLCILVGTRTGELSALTYSDYDKSKKILTVSKTEVRCKKDGRYEFKVRESTKGKYPKRQVPLMDEAIDIIERVHNRNPEAVYLFEKAGKRIRGKAFSDKLVRLCRQAGIKPRSIHKIRKTFVTTLKKAGLDDKAICAVVGHSQIETSNTYYYFNNAEVDEIRNSMKAAFGTHKYSRRIG